MDLSGLKWPLIIVIIIAIGWLASSGGVNFMYKNFTKAVPGQNATQDKADEAGLTRLGGYLLKLFRYEKAAQMMRTAIDRYGTDGANYWYNCYRMSQCYYRMEMYQQDYDILTMLMAENAHEKDDRVPNNDNLRLQASKLKEMHELP